MKNHTFGTSFRCKLHFSVGSFVHFNGTNLFNLLVFGIQRFLFVEVNAFILFAG